MLEDVLAQQGRRVVSGSGVGPDSDFGAVPVDPTVFCVSERADRRFTVHDGGAAHAAKRRRLGEGLIRHVQYAGVGPKDARNLCSGVDQDAMWPSVASLGNVTWVLIIGLRPPW